MILSQKRSRGLQIGILLLSGACTTPSLEPGAGARLQSLVLRYLDAHWRAHPEEATGAGVHDYDHRLAPTGAAEIKARVAELRAFGEALEALPAQDLEAREGIDRRLMLSDIRVRLARIEREKVWQRHPSRYLPFSGLYDLVTGEGPVEVRARRLLGRLRQVPRVIEDGMRNLQNPPRLFTEIGIRAADGAIPFYEQAIPAFARHSGLQVDLERANREALASMKRFRAFLQEELLPRSNGSVAIGRELYDFYLSELHLLDHDADTLLAEGQRYLDRIEAQLEEAAAAIDPEKSWQEITESLRDRHPSAEGLLDAYCDEIQRARRHIVDKDLVTLTVEEEVRCIPTPASRRPFSPFGVFRTPAPFSEEHVGYLILHPIDPELSPEAKERLLRAHDYTWISVIAPHEAYPGHHLQAIKAQQNPRLFRKVYSSPLFSEGWGLYCEELAYETGFFRNPAATRLTQLRLRLWRAARIVLDVKLHTGRISYDEARRFLVQRVRMDESATAGEVNIYARRPTYAISYLVGYHEIMKLREEYRRLKGDSFSLREFHDHLLGLGSIPFKLVRESLRAGD